MKIQEYLKARSLTAAVEEFGLKIKQHEVLPLTILNYSINSQKICPIASECRGLVLETDTWNLVAKAFNRFYRPEECSGNNFNWNNFTTTTKLDGSLILTYFYAGTWHINTRGAFGNGSINPTMTDKSWKQVIEPLIPFKNMDPIYTYVWEFVSPYSQVVRYYDKPQVWLLTAFYKEQEVIPYLTDNIPKVETHNFKSFQECVNFVTTRSAVDSTWEGLVVKDDNNLRLKIKSKTYDSWHTLKGNDWRPNNFISFILGGLDSVFLEAFPGKARMYLEFKEKVQNEFNILESLWEKYKDIESQKEFALSIKDKTKFTSFLFRLRKDGVKRRLWDIWIENQDKVAEVLC